MDLIKEHLGLINLVVGVMLVPLVKFLFDMRLKIERLETIINIMLKEIEQLKHHLGGGDDKD
ncbi:TPA: hypothetical protein [Thermocrinis Great Boiling Spring virus]|jgi:hypothetical protein|nr:TPA: hypothetical protein [Thermocrinis Great Boiling Spring virus]